MIHLSGTLPAECQPKLLQFNSSSSKKPETRRDRSQEQKQIAKSNPRSPLPKPSPTPQRQTPSISPLPQSPEIEDVLKIAKERPDITGGVIGIGVASLMAIIGGVPLAVAVGIGAVVWLAIQTVLSAVNLNYDNHLILHLLWLLWACGAFGLLAAWSYQRDRAVQ